jgi:hypothetical protein
MVLGRSCQALDAIEEGLTDATNDDACRRESARAFKLVERVVKHTGKPAALSQSL